MQELIYRLCSGLTNDQPGDKSREGVICTEGVSYATYLLPLGEGEGWEERVRNVT